MSGDGYILVVGGWWWIAVGGYGWWWVVVGGSIVWPNPKFYDL